MNALHVARTIMMVSAAEAGLYLTGFESVEHIHVSWI